MGFPDTMPCMDEGEREAVERSGEERSVARRENGMRTRGSEIEYDAAMMRTRMMRLRQPASLSLPPSITVSSTDSIEDGRVGSGRNAVIASENGVARQYDREFLQMK